MALKFILSVRFLASAYIQSKGLAAPFTYLLFIRLLICFSKKDVFLCVCVRAFVRANVPVDYIKTSEVGKHPWTVWEYERYL